MQRGGGRNLGPRDSCMNSSTLPLKDRLAIIRCMATVSEALAIAVQRHQGGRLDAAEQIYRRIIEVDRIMSMRFIFSA